MDDDWLVDYYRQKLLERYTACVNRDSRLKIADMLRTVDVETMDTVIQFLELKKQEGAQMPKNSNNASVPTTDAPISIEDQFAKLSDENKEIINSLIERLTAGQSLNQQ